MAVSRTNAISSDLSKSHVGGSCRGLNARSNPSATARGSTERSNRRLSNSNDATGCYAALYCTGAPESQGPGFLSQRRRDRAALAAQTERLDQLLVAIEVLALQVVEERAALTEQVEAAERSQRFLLQAADALARTTGFSDTLQALAEVAVPTLGDLCLIDVADDSVTGKPDDALLSTNAGGTKRYAS